MPSGSTDPPKSAGPNPLFIGVVVAVVIGAIAALGSGDTKTVFGSNIVFHLLVGAVAFVIAYGVVAALWFAWHRKTFKSVHVGPAGATAPDQAIDDETDARDNDIAKFMSTTTKAIDEINARLDALE